jgi:hypothetical protein
MKKGSIGKRIELKTDFSVVLVELRKTDEFLYLSSLKLLAERVGLFMDQAKQPESMEKEN